MAETPTQGEPDGLPPDFDTTAELWDRLVDDITGKGAPCLETLERLVGEACRANPAPLPDPDK